MENRAVLPYSLALIVTLAGPTPPVSAPITNIQYDVTFNRGPGAMELLRFHEDALAREPAPEPTRP